MMDLRWIRELIGSQVSSMCALGYTSLGITGSRHGMELKPNTEGASWQEEAIY